MSDYNSDDYSNSSSPLGETNESFSFDIDFDKEKMFKKTKIIIFSELNGKRRNTYIMGLELTKEELKTHLKNLKRKHGCNGSVKIKNYQNIDFLSIHLQGDMRKNACDYLIDHMNIKESDIDVKD